MKRFEARGRLKPLPHTLGLTARQRVDYRVVEIIHPPPTPISTLFKSYFIILERVGCRLVRLATVRIALKRVFFKAPIAIAR